MSEHLETRVVHSIAPDVQGSRPVSVPIFQTSSFAFDDTEVMSSSMTTPDGAPMYTRLGNPTVRALEATMAGLEGGTAAIATGSGMGAINTVLLSQLKTGDHMITQRSIYGGTFAVLSDLVERYGIEVTYVSGGDPAEVRAAVRPATRLLYLETISNPMATVSDLPALFAAGHGAGLVNVVDNTFASPLFCRPIEHGADIVVHSASKYLGGHDDVIGGIAVFAGAELHRKVWRQTVELGFTMDPFAAWLTLRGIKTLALRVRRQADTAEILVRRLAEHPAVDSVHWPGLESHPDHDVAKRILEGYGGVFAFDLAGGREAGAAFLGRLRLAHMAGSLGAVETRALHPASTSHRQLSADELAAAGIGAGTVRVAVGIEHPEDLWADFRQALS